MPVNSLLLLYLHNNITIANNFIAAGHLKYFLFIYIDLPREGPRITGNEEENRRGDSLFLNCTSGRSYPAAILSWDIDGELVSYFVLFNIYCRKH